MTVALLDTNAVSDLMKDHAVLKGRVLRQSSRVITTVTVVGEIRHGLERLPTGKRRTDLENRAAITLSFLKIETVTDAIADEYGRLKAESERLGLTVGDNDLWIASAARHLAVPLVSRDKIFSLLPGLVVEDWTV
jgi:predicted nucleic acid-binding protein